MILESNDQQRRFNRVKVVQKVWLNFQGFRYGPCRIKDINVSGLFVCGTFYQKKGDECIIGYSQKRTASHFYFKAKARIIRATKDGVALEFKSMPLDSYILLQSTLLYEAADPWTIACNLPADCPFTITEDI